MLGLLLLLVTTGGLAVDLSLTILPDSVEEGAVCLDGSPSGYYFRKGSTDPDKWILWIFGGQQCNTEAECVERSRTPFGSSKQWTDKLAFEAFYSDNCQDNPHFCGWTLVAVPYCDGGFFAGNASDPVQVGSDTIYFRGIRILDAVIDNLLTSRGLSNAEHVVFVGSSTGGLGIYLHIDHIRDKIPNSVPLHGFEDAGYFIDASNTDGEYRIRSNFQSTFELHNMSSGVDQDCLTAMSRENTEWKCLFPQYTYRYVNTPVFSCTSPYDSFQLATTLGLSCMPPDCSEEEMKQFHYFGQAFFEAVSPAIQSDSNGVFIDSCVVHGQLYDPKPWAQYRVNNQTIGDSFYNWITQGITNYEHKKEFLRLVDSSSSNDEVIIDTCLNYDQSAVLRSLSQKSIGHEHKNIDCVYPCNPTCTAA